MDVGVERPGRKEIHSPSSAEVKNKWICTSTPRVPCGVHKNILTLTFSVCWGRTVARAVSRRPFNTKAGLKFQDNVCEILWWPNSQWDRVSPSTSLSLCHLYSTSHLHTRIHHLQCTCRVSAVDSVVKTTPIKPVHLYTHHNCYTMVFNRWSFVLFTPRIWVQFWNSRSYSLHTAM